MNSIGARIFTSVVSRVISYEIIRWLNGRHSRRPVRRTYGARTQYPLWRYAFSIVVVAVILALIFA